MSNVSHQDIPERECAVCGRSFKPYCKTQKICSFDCRMIWQNRRAKKRKKIKEQAPAIVKVCPYCGTEFVTTNTLKVYCSNNCKTNYGRKKILDLAKDTDKTIIWDDRCFGCSWFTPCGGKKGFCMFPTCAKERMKINRDNY